MEKIQFAILTIICMTGIIIAAMIIGHDGVLLAASMGIIGSIAGSILGFSIGAEKQKTVIDEVIKPVLEEISKKKD